MKCIFCGYPESKVVDSRPLEDGTATRRRRECIKCQRRFTTYEKPEQAVVLVVKKDGRREEFSVEKIKRGIIRACEKRNVSMDKIESMAFDIERAVLNEGASEIPAQHIGDLVMDALRDVDQVAYVRFASVYREFKDVSTFMDELKKLLAEK